MVSLIHQHSTPYIASCLANLTYPPLQPNSKRHTGVKQDIKSNNNKTTKDPPVAWSHKFLNKKPWHPMNYRNRTKVWQAEQQAYQEAKSVQRAKQEFQAQQEKFNQLALLPGEEGAMLRQKQAVSWMYTKPPGFQDAIIPPGGANNNNNDGANTNEQQQQQQHGDNSKKGNTNTKHVNKVVQGIRASSQLILKNISHPHGGGDPTADNQTFVLPHDHEDDDNDEKEEEDVGRERRRMERRRKKVEEEERVEEAKRFLKSAGILTDSSDSDSEDRDGRKKKRRRQKKSRVE